MKIFFCTSITNNKTNAITKKLIEYLELLGHEVLNGYIKNPLPYKQNEGLTRKEIAKSIRNKLEKSDIIIAEVTNPSKGAFFEIGYGTCSGKKILTIRKEKSYLSEVFYGFENIKNKEYNNLEEAKGVIKAFLTNITKSSG